MRLLFRTILVVILVVQPLRQLIVVANFELRQSVIAATVCVKKDIPGNTCQGKCQLRKQLEQSADQDTSDPQNPSAPVTEKINAILEYRSGPQPFLDYTILLSYLRFEALASFSMLRELPPRA